MRGTEEQLKRWMEQGLVQSIDGEAFTTRSVENQRIELDSSNILMLKSNREKELEEWQVQKNLFQRIEEHVQSYPALDLAFHPDNGQSKSRVARARMSGIRSGVPDVMIPAKFYNLGRFHTGLAIDLKVKYNGPEDSQIEYMSLLLEQDWVCAFAWSEQEAWRLICQCYGINSS